MVFTEKGTKEPASTRLFKMVKKQVIEIAELENSDISGVIEEFVMIGIQDYFKKHSKTKSVAVKAKEVLSFDTWPYPPSEQIRDDWLKAKKQAGGSVSQSAINTIGKEIKKAVDAGFSVDDCLAQAENGKWKGFKAEWMKVTETVSSNKRYATTTDAFNDKDLVDFQ